MRKTKIFTFGLLALTFSCSNPNAEHIEKIKQQVKEDALGIELNYKNIEFQWTDTLYVKEKLVDVSTQFNQRLQVILDIEYFVKDNLEKGKVFTKNYLTKDRFTELRNWEINVGHPNQSSPGRAASWVKDGHKDYYEFAFANRNASPWISELCTQVEETDKLLENYEGLEEGNLAFIQNALWYYKRIDDFKTSTTPSDLWDKVEYEIAELNLLKAKVDSLSALDPNQVIHYKALNTYKINNPILNGAEQELKKYFIFNSQLEIIGDEKFEK